MALRSCRFLLPILLFRLCECVGPPNTFPPKILLNPNRDSCGAFQLYYETDLLKQHSSSSITWIVTIQIFLMFFLGPVIGILVDVVGPRPIVTSAGIISLLGICMLSLCKQYWQVLLAQGICFGIGAAGLFLPAMVAVGQWFTTKRGLAMGIVASGSSVGQYCSKTPYSSVKEY